MSVLARYRLPLGVLTVFVVGTDLFVVSPLLPLIAADVHVGVGRAALAVPVFSAAYLLASPAMGRLAERCGHRRVLLTGMVVFALANMLTGLAPTFEVLLGTRLLAGAGAAAITPSLYACTGGLAPRGRRGTWLAVLGAGLLSALAVGAPLGSLAAGASGWRAVFLTIAGLVLALVLPQRLSWPPRLYGSTPSSPSTPVPAWRRARAVSVTALWGAAVYGFYTYLGPQLHADFGPGVVAWALLAYGLGAVAGSVVGGHLADRLGAGRVVAASHLALAGCLVVLAVGWPAPVLAVAGLAGVAVTAYPAFPAHQARLTAGYPGRSASMMAWNNSALYTGILAGSAVAGPVHAVAGFRGVLALCTCLALAGVAASRGAVDRPRRRRFGLVDAPLARKDRA